MSSSNKVLLAGPWVGEFGWELFAWHAYIRTLSKHYDKTICISRNASKALYEDFVDNFISYEPNAGLADAFFMHGLNINKVLLYNIIKDKIDLKGSQVSWFAPRRIGWPPQTHYNEEFTFENHTVKPEYIKFGNKNSDSHYDYIFHIRDRELRKEDNWDMKKWTQLLKLLQTNGEKVGCIGTKAESGWINGTDDLRGKSLKGICDILRNAKCTFGSSSGPMHLASLCGCPHVVWSIGSNFKRYTETWNPLQSPILFLDEFEWHPSADYIYENFNKWRNR